MRGKIRPGVYRTIDGRVARVTGWNGRYWIGDAPGYFAHEGEREQCLWMPDGFAVCCAMAHTLKQRIGDLPDA